MSKILSPEVERIAEDLAEKDKRDAVKKKAKQDKKDKKKLTDKQRIERIEEYLGLGV